MTQTVSNSLTKRKPTVLFPSWTCLSTASQTRLSKSNLAVLVSCRASWPYILHIYRISSQQSQITLLSFYGMTANHLLSCADLFLFFVSIVFFLFWHWSCFTLSKIHFFRPQTYLQRPSSWGWATAGRQDVMSHVHTAKLRLSKVSTGE